MTFADLSPETNGYSWTPTPMVYHFDADPLLRAGMYAIAPAHREPGS